MIADAVSFGSRGKTRNPVSLSLMISGFAPTRVATTGRSIARAWVRTWEIPSVSTEHNTTTFIMDSKDGISSRFPRKHTRSCMPNWRTKFSKTLRISPSPTIKNLAWGIFWDTSAAACKNTSIPFSLRKKPIVPTMAENFGIPNTSFNLVSGSRG